MPLSTSIFAKKMVFAMRQLHSILDFSVEDARLCAREITGDKREAILMYLDCGSNSTSNEFPLNDGFADSEMRVHT